MSDIVERLREKTVTPFIHGLASELQIKDPTDLELEAATEILRLRAENEKLRAAMHDIYEVYAGSEGFIPETCAEGYLQERVKEMADIAAKHKRAALKETGDE